MATCRLCGDRYKKSVMERHEREGCPKRIVRCPHQCGEKMKVEVLQEHYQNECHVLKRRHTLVQSALAFEQHPAKPCGNGCGATFKRPGEKRDHEEKLCVSRSVECEEVGCDLAYKMDEPQLHFDTVCNGRDKVMRRAERGFTPTKEYSDGGGGGNSGGSGDGGDGGDGGSGDGGGGGGGGSGNNSSRNTGNTSGDGSGVGGGGDGDGDGDGGGSHGQSRAPKLTSTSAPALYLCELGCGATMRMTRKIEHNSEECHFRFLPCRYLDCKKRIRACDQEEHEAHTCMATSAQLRKNAGPRLYGTSK